MNLLPSLLLLLGSLSGARCQCSFPDALVGRTMVSNTLGELTFSRDSVVFKEGIRTNNLNLDFRPPVPLTFNCNGTGPANEYWLVSESYTVGSRNLTVELSVCWDLIRVTDDKWIYYEGPKEFLEGYGTYILPKALNSGSSATINDVCNLDTPRPANTYHMLLDATKLGSQFSSCPDALLGTFEANSSSGNCVTQLDVCPSSTRHTVTVTDATDCSTNKFYSTDGKMECLHSISQNDITYVMMYTPEATNVTYSCMLLFQEDKNLYITQTSGSCDGRFDANHTTVLPAPTKTTYEHLLTATKLCPFPCSFPDALQGTWVSTQKGEVTVASTQLTGLYGKEVLECYRKEDNRYLIRANVTTMNNEDVRVYMCLELTQETPNKYLYYERHISKHAKLHDYVVTFNAGQSLTLAQACEDLSASSYKATRHHLLLKTGTVGDSYVTCPDDVLGIFNDTVNGCMFQSCTDATKISVTQRACNPKPFYSGDGAVGCLYSVKSSGTTYVTVHNADATPDGKSTYAFTCVALKTTGSTLKLSQNPEECLDEQTPESVATNHTFTYKRTEDCPTDEIDWVLILIIVFCILLVIIIIVIIIVCIVCRKKRAKRRQKEDEEAAILAKKSKEKDEEDFGTNRSTDSGYGVSPRTASGPGSRRSRRGVGTPMSHYAETYDVAEEEEPKQHNTVVSKLRHRPGRRLHKDGTTQEHENESDGEWNYSDTSWEEYVDEEGNTQVRPKEKRERRRKKMKHKYTKTRVLEDGTMIEEEVESEYSVTESSDEGEDLGEKIREAKEKRKARLGIIMATEMTSAEDRPIVTREMDEKMHQPELEMNRSLANTMQRRARDIKESHHDSLPSSSASSRDSSPAPQSHRAWDSDGGDDDEIGGDEALVVGLAKLTDSAGEGGGGGEDEQGDQATRSRDKSGKDRARSRSPGSREEPEQDGQVIRTGGEKDGPSSETEENRSLLLLQAKGRGGAGAMGVKAVTTREMDEKKKQPERKKKQSLLNRLKGRARGLRGDGKAGKAKKRSLFKGGGAVQGVVPGTGEGNEIPYLLQYQKKKELEQVLTDEGFFEDPKNKGTSEADYGFLQMDRVLSPRQRSRQGQGVDSTGGSSETVGDSRKLDDVDEKGGDVRTGDDVGKGDDARKGDDIKSKAGGKGDDENLKSTERDQKVHVTSTQPLVPGSSNKKEKRHRGAVSPMSTVSTDFSSDDGEEGGRKSSDTSSGVADLSHDQQSSAERGRRTALGSHKAGGRGGGPGDDRDRRISIGWEKLQVLHSRNKLHADRHGDDDDRRSHSRHGHRGGKKSKTKKDKRVKTALRRLLNERLFGSSDKKKSRRDDDATESWTNSESVDNHHRGRFGHGKGAGGSDGRKDASESADDQNSKRRVRLASGPGHHDDPDAADDENEENGGHGQERPPTRPGTMLPPLRTHQTPVSRVYTPANYPKWGLYVTASQRNMLLDGLQRDRSFLSRTQARSAWGSRGDTNTSLSTRSGETGRGGTATDDESALDPHRPDTESVHSDAGSEAKWANKRKAKTAPSGNGSRSVAFTQSSGRSPLDWDDKRLKRLLEELYKDKKFMDKLINKIDEDHLEFPDHIAAEDVKFLSEFGRGYLLERADYWEMHGPLGPPRPPPSALGARLARSHTSTSMRASHPDSTQEDPSPRPKTVR